MAFMLMGSCKIWLSLMFLSSIVFSNVKVSGKEFLVGDDNGWALPKKEEPVFNAWASRNRFKVNDTLRFKYEKDSVMEVTEEDYKSCRSAHPIFFSNNGDTLFKFDRGGFFYFISGVNGHCQRGQRMIIKVLEIETPPSNSTIKNGSATAAAAIQVPPISSTIIIFLGLSFFCLIIV